MALQHAAVGKDQRAVTDADQDPALGRLRGKPGQQDGVFAALHSRHDDVVGAIRIVLVEFGETGVRLHLQAAAHADHAGVGGDCQHVGHVGAFQHAIRQHEVADLRVMVRAKNGDDGTFAAKARLVRIRCGLGGCQ
jgi:hypothetical protein